MPTRLAAVAALVVASVVAAQPVARPGLRFTVAIDPALPVQAGRVLVAVGPKNGTPDFTEYKPPVLPVLGADLTVGRAATLDVSSDVFPVAPALNDLPAGEYTVQAILATNRDINLPDAPGNLFCAPVKVKLDPAAGTTVNLTLDKTFAERKLKDTATHKFLALPSKLLSDFHGRPMTFRVGVVLPPNFDKEPEKNYGLILDIGGFGTRYTDARRTSPDKRFVQVVPDGAGPFGDPYQVNSANNGPYGDALVKEVIPYLEKAFRCGGTGKRFTCGASTGGWVSLALQLYYPDTFNGCWSQCPDSLTFERFELIDLYA
ncbi:MAG TPA: alpha/beta hydrolase-fold protein, partial [Urbifossiella sp.]|nr:alpha/beta hydrolase-fold protein [Urbifossiella sp.]